MSAPENVTLSIENFVTVSLSAAPMGLEEPNVNTAALISQDAPSGWAGGQVVQPSTRAHSQVRRRLRLELERLRHRDRPSSTQTPNPVDTQGYLVIIPRLTSPSLETVQAAIARTTQHWSSTSASSSTSSNSPTSQTDLPRRWPRTARPSDEDVLVYARPRTSPTCSRALAWTSCARLRRRSCAASTTATTLLNGAAVQQTQIFAAAYAGRGLSTNFNASLSSTTMNGKQLIGITPDQTLDQTYLNQADAAGVDVYASFNGFSCLKTSGANAYFDQAYQRQWLVFALQTAGFNYLVGVGTKVPQTEDGMNGLKDAYIQVLKQAVANGYLGTPASCGIRARPSAIAPTWSATSSRQGFYIYSPAHQSADQRRGPQRAASPRRADRRAGSGRRFIRPPSSSTWRLKERTHHVLLSPSPGKIPSIINGHVFHDLADGDCGKLVYDEDLSKLKVGKDGNAVIGQNQGGRLGHPDAPRRAWAPSDDKYLNGLLASYPGRLGGLRPGPRLACSRTSATARATAIPSSTTWLGGAAEAHHARRHHQHRGRPEPVRRRVDVDSSRRSRAPFSKNRAVKPQGD
jgi:hypothetical protein